MQYFFTSCLLIVLSCNKNNPEFVGKVHLRFQANSNKKTIISEERNKIPTQEKIEAVLLTIKTLQYENLKINPLVDLNVQEMSPYLFYNDLCKEEVYYMTKGCFGKDYKLLKRILNKKDTDYMYYQDMKASQNKFYYTRDTTYLNSNTRITTPVFSVNKNIFIISIYLHFSKDSLNRETYIFKKEKNDWNHYLIFKS